MSTPVGKFSFKVPSTIMGQNKPVWNAGSLASVNVQQDSLNNGDSIYFDAAQNLWVTGNIPSSGILFATGSAGAPSITFQSDTDTGIYLENTNKIGFSTAGVSRLGISSTGVNIIPAVYGGVGTVSLPEYSFGIDPNTGLYWVGADHVGVTTGGANALTISSTGANIIPAVYGGVGTVSLPEYSFGIDPNTGLYWVGAGHVGVTTGGANAVTISPTGMNLSAGLKLNVNTVAANAIAGVSGALAAGTVTISTTKVTANSVILVSHATAAGTMGQLSIGTITAGVSFAILTDNVLDTSTVNWFILN